MYKISEDYAVRSILGECVVVPVTGSCDNSTGFITVNESGKIIIDAIIAGKSRDEAAADICAEFETDIQTAAADVDEFIRQFKEIGVIVEK